jgi:hypothetical protein
MGVAVLSRNRQWALTLAELGCDAQRRLLPLNFEKDFAI